VGIELVLGPAEHIMDTTRAGDLEFSSPAPLRILDAHGEIVDGASF
jgi:hypothetical protein